MEYICTCQAISQIRFLQYLFVAKLSLSGQKCGRLSGHYCMYISIRTIGERFLVSGRTYVFVIDQLHQLELPVGPLRVRHVLKGSGELLDRDVLRGHRVVRRAEKKITMQLEIRDRRRSLNTTLNTFSSRARALIARKLRKRNQRRTSSRRSPLSHSSSSSVVGFS